MKKIALKHLPNWYLKIAYAQNYRDLNEGSIHHSGKYLAFKNCQCLWKLSPDFGMQKLFFWWGKTISALKGWRSLAAVSCQHWGVLLLSRLHLPQARHPMWHSSKLQLLTKHRSVSLFVCVSSEKHLMLHMEWFIDCSNYPCREKGNRFKCFFSEELKALFLTWVEGADFKTPFWITVGIQFSFGMFNALYAHRNVCA